MANISDSKVLLRNVSVNNISFSGDKKTFSLNPNADGYIWNGYSRLALRNFKLVSKDIAVFSQNIQNGNLLMFVDGYQQTISQAFSKFQNLKQYFLTFNSMGNVIEKVDDRSIPGLPGEVGSAAIPDIISTVIALPANSTNTNIFRWPIAINYNYVQKFGMRATYWLQDISMAGVIDITSAVGVLDGYVSISNTSMSGQLPTNWTVNLSTLDGYIYTSVTAGNVISLWNLKLWLDDPVELVTSGTAPLPNLILPSIAITAPKTGWLKEKGKNIYVGGIYERGTGNPTTITILDSYNSIIGSGKINGNKKWGAHVKLATAGAYSLIARITDSLNQTTTSVAISGIVEDSLSDDPVDTIAPQIVLFAAPQYSPTLTFNFISAPQATDDIAVTGYIVTTNDAVAPLANDGRWGASPTEITTIAGTNVFRAYAIDAAENISAPVSQTTITDITTPVVTFVVGATSSALQIPITTLTSTFGASGSGGYIVTVDDAVVPLANDVRWGVAPTSITVVANGTYILRAYSRSNAGLVSSAVQQSVTVAVASVYFSDNFDRENGSIGNGWLTASGASAAIVSNEMSRNDGGEYVYGAIYHESNAPGGDYWCHIEFNDAALSEGTHVVGFFARANSTLSNAVRFMWQFTRTGNPLASLQAANDANNTATFVLVNALPASWSLVQGHYLDISCIGDRVTLYCDGIEYGYITSTQLATTANTHFGICGTCSVGSLARYNNVVISASRYQM